MVFCLTIQLQLAIVTVYGGWDFYFYELTYLRQICISGVLRGNDWIAVSTVTVVYTAIAFPIQLRPKIGSFLLISTIDVLSKLLPQFHIDRSSHHTNLFQVIYLTKASHPCVTEYL